MENRLSLGKDRWTADFLLIHGHSGAAYCINPISNQCSRCAAASGAAEPGGSGRPGGRQDHVLEELAVWIPAPVTIRCGHPTRSSAVWTVATPPQARCRGAAGTPRWKGYGGKAKPSLDW